MVKPVSCFVDIALLKAALSPAIQQRKPKLTGRFKIDRVEVVVSQFLLRKLKDRLEPLGEGALEVEEFVETNVTSIREEHDLAGPAKVSWDAFKKMSFHCVLKGSFMYFFINDQHPKYHLFVDLT